MVESVPQDPAKARQQAKPKTAAEPKGAVAESGKNIQLFKINNQHLVNAQVEVNRAVFLMNARNNPNTLKHFEDPNRDFDTDISQHVALAIKELQKAVS